MKRAAALIAALILLVNSCALALVGTDYPAWDGSAAPDNSLCASFGGQNLILEFDAAPEYSKLENGSLQACFFAFNSSEELYLEAYLMLPENAAPGDVYAPGNTTESCSLSLYEVTKTDEDLYFAGVIGGFPYPGSENFEVRIDSVQRSADAISMRGAIRAELMHIVNNQPGDTRLTLENAQFSFTLPLNGTSAPAATQTPEAAPQQPEQTHQPLPPALETPAPQPATLPPAVQPTLDPHPAFTLPPDYRIL